MPPQISVLMPTYDHAAFIQRAIDSLLAQTLTEWELVIVDDGSPDGTSDVVAPYLDDPRITYHRLPDNRGLGSALNYALEQARASLIAYLPSDDVYYAGHLASLAGLLVEHAGAALAYSGVCHHYNRSASGPIEGYSLQLVQVLHRRTADLWLTRDEYVTDDLDRMYWAKLRAHGPFVSSERVTCEWVDHPHQLHKVVREPVGGINTYRSRFGVKQPLRFHTSCGNRIDEVGRYQHLRDRADT